MHDDSLDPGPHSAGDPVSFRLMSNLMDIASAAGECAEAMRTDFECDTDATVAALRLVDRVKTHRRIVHDSCNESHGKGDHSRDRWASIHADVLSEGFSVYARLREYSAVTLGNAHSEPLTRLAAKISVGFKLKGLPLERVGLAA
ncbi:hypothetical protein OIU34_22995 [Pararhizobium sp. BT-229]|uniref:hypothetical protein n=1 Tax=Pararhizobium sp. BT-229 TaxID=2986923 RepID=UPI0021F7DC18|nr:hypothetical protein [Pararhizobium sp. BT-229]MCV9964762.1 hypothetical protein [Pararhizobium sp. BT-229]